MFILDLLKGWVLALALYLVAAVIFHFGRPEEVQRKGGFTVTLITPPPICEPQFHLSKAPLSKL